MCVIVFVPGGRQLPSEQTLKDCWDTQRDGGGFSWFNPDKGEMEIFKTMEKAMFLEEVQKKHAAFGENDFVLHCRYGSYGKRCVDNAHPFVLKNKAVMFHNGELFKMDEKDKMSDTAYFAHRVLQGLPEDWMYNDAVWHMIETFAGAQSKLIFQWVEDGVPKMRIIGEKQGRWNEGLWYSNSAVIPWKRGAALDKKPESGSKLKSGNKLICSSKGCYFCNATRDTAQYLIEDAVFTLCPSCYDAIKQEGY